MSQDGALSMIRQKTRLQSSKTLTLGVHDEGYRCNLLWCMLYGVYTYSESDGCHLS